MLLFFWFFVKTFGSTLFASKTTMKPKPRTKNLTNFFFKVVG